MKRYGAIIIENNKLLFKSGWKFIELKPRITIWNKVICYKGKKFNLSDFKNEKTYYFSFEDKDIIYESFNKIELSNCIILETLGYADKSNQNFWFDLNMNPYPISHVSDKNGIGTLYDNRNYIKINTDDKDISINIIGKTNLTDIEIKDKFNEYMKNKEDYFTWSSFHDFTKHCPSCSIYFFNLLNLMVFKNYIKQLNSIDTPFHKIENIREMDVFNINQLNKIEPNNFYDDCEIWNFKGDKFQIEEHINLLDYNNLNGDQDKYMVFKVASYSIYNKNLSMFRIKGFDIDNIVILIKLNKQSLKDFLDKKLINKLKD